MAISELALSSVRMIYGGTMTGLGFGLARQMRERGSQIIGVIIALVAGVGGVVLPFMAGRRIAQWHPVGWGAWLAKVLILWGIVAGIGWGLLWFAILLLVLIGALFGAGPFTEAETWELVMMLTWVIFVPVLLIGLLRGLTERRERKRAHQFEPPRVYRRVIGLNFRPLFQRRSRFRRSSPLLLAA